MDTESTENWQDLRIGDRIRIVRVPSLFNESLYHDRDWDETLALYFELIANQTVFAISTIDEDGRPWIEFELVEKDGTTVSHSLALDDDSWAYASHFPSTKFWILNCWLALIMAGGWLYYIDTALELYLAPISAALAALFRIDGKCESIHLASSIFAASSLMLTPVFC